MALQLPSKKSNHGQSHFGAITYKKYGERTERGAFLDHNEVHHVLLWDGPITQGGWETKFRELPAYLTPKTSAEANVDDFLRAF